MTTTTTDTRTILDALNNYDGADIWQDVIYGQLNLDVDDDTIDELDPTGSSTTLPLTDGRIFRYVEQDDRWALDA